MKPKLPPGLILLSLLIFLGGSTAGYLSAEEISSQMMGILGEEFSFLTELPPPILALAIFINNLSKTLIAMLLGVLLAIPPVLFILANGFILGIVGFEVVKCKGLLFLVLGVLPHGIFEVFAATLSTALGIRLGIAVYRRLRRQRFEVKYTLKLCLKTYFSWVIPLLALSAVIEVYLTPLLLSIL